MDPSSLECHDFMWPFQELEIAIEHDRAILPDYWQPVFIFQLLKKPRPPEDAGRRVDCIAQP
jgi:hypothetical protein